jgi:hypothetical protein
MSGYLFSRWLTPSRAATTLVAPQENAMEIKPTNLDEVQINEDELDEVVGGKDVLDLQEAKAPGEDDGCVSFQSCVSFISG